MGGDAEKEDGEKGRRGSTWGDKEEGRGTQQKEDSERKDWRGRGRGGGPEEVRGGMRRNKEEGASEREKEKNHRICQGEAAVIEEKKVFQRQNLGRQQDARGRNGRSHR